MADMGDKEYIWGGGGGGGGGGGAGPEGQKKGEKGGGMFCRAVMWKRNEEKTRQAGS